MESLRFNLNKTMAYSLRIKIKMSNSNKEVPDGVVLRL